MGPRKATSWTEKYYAKDDQEFTLEEWDKLLHRDIADFDVEWQPDGLIFADGETIR